MKPKNKKKFIWITIFLLLIAGFVAWIFWPKATIISEDRVLIKKTDNHIYELLVQFEEPIYNSIVRSAIAVKIFVLQDGEPVETLPEELGTNQSPIHLKITPQNKGVLDDNQSDDWKMLTYLRSPQAQPDWVFDFVDGTDTLQGTLGLSAYYGPVYTIKKYEDTDGYAEFEYFYGNAQSVPDVLFEIEAVFDFASASIQREIHFNPPPLQNDVISAKVTSSEDFYYDIEITPTWQDTKYNLFYTFTDLERSSMRFEAENIDDYYDEIVRSIPERVLNIKIISKNKKTGEVNTNPYQRVKVEMIPLFYVNPKDNTRFEFPGRLTGQFSWNVTGMPEWAKAIGFTGLISTMQDLYLSKILYSRGESLRVAPNGKPIFAFDPIHWFAYHSIPSVKHVDSFQRVQLDIDLINGVGELVFNPSLKYADASVIAKQVIEDGGSEAKAKQIVNNAGINQRLKNQSYPKVIISVKPENYDLVDYSECGHRITNSSLKQIPTGTYREIEEICVPQKDDSSKSNFLYQEWMEDGSIQERVHTVIALSPEDLLYSEVTYKPLEDTKKFSQILIFAITSQLVQLIIGGIMLMVLKRKQKRKLKSKKNHEK